MAYDVAADPRLDPRIKAILSALPSFSVGDVRSRDDLVAEALSDAAREGSEAFRAFMELCDTEELAPSAGLRIHTEKIVSAPDGNTINLQVIRPDTDETVACVYYIHGGGMATLSCYDGMYRAWGEDHRGQRCRGRHGRLPQLRFRPRRYPRSSPSRPGSTTASPVSNGSSRTRRS